MPVGRNRRRWACVDQTGAMAGVGSGTLWRSRSLTCRVTVRCKREAARWLHSFVMGVLFWMAVLHGVALRPHLPLSIPRRATGTARRR